MWEKFKLTVLDGMSKYIPKNVRQRKIKGNFQPFSAELRQLIVNIAFGIIGCLPERKLYIENTK